MVDFRKKYTKYIKEGVYNFAVAGDIDQENPVNPDNAKEIQDILEKNPSCIIFSGSPASVHDNNAPNIDAKIFPRLIILLSLKN